MRELCEPAGWEILSYAKYAPPAEGEASYEANAALKARALFDQLTGAGVPFDAVLGDDSGIEADALDGRPGVLSARYGGEDATWAERRRRLIQEVDGAQGSRGARFVCVLHCIETSGRALTAEGFAEGSIVASERGDGGFSYDALFFYPPLGRTFAELKPAEKNAVSHRAVAIRKLRRALEGQASRM